MRKTLVQTILAAFCAILCVTSSVGGDGMNRRRILAGLGAHTPTAKDYVQDGLIAMWDGIENAGWGVHDPNATVWKDLSGNGYDFNLTQHATILDDSVEGDGQGVIGDFNYDIVKTPLTIEVCAFDYLKKNTTLEIIGTKFGWGCYYGSMNSARTNSVIFFIGNRSPDYTKFDGQCFCAINSEDFGSLVYINGAKAMDVKDYIGGKSYIAKSGITTIGGVKNLASSGYGRFLTGRILYLRLYEREFTIDEIAANYAVDKARFNLT